jgi:hypothetical protein
MAASEARVFVMISLIEVATLSDYVDARVRGRIDDCKPQRLPEPFR